MLSSRSSVVRFLPSVFFAVKSPAGSGVMGEDYTPVDNAEELVRMVDEKVAEIRAAEVGRRIDVAGD